MHILNLLRIFCNLYPCKLIYEICVIHIHILAIYICRYHFIYIRSNRSQVFFRATVLKNLAKLRRKLL